MALFIGGAADGLRASVEGQPETFNVAINPHPPAYTPDNTVYDAKAVPTQLYKREKIGTKQSEYFIYVPVEWTTEQLLEALITGYKDTKSQLRTAHILNARGEIFANENND